ncbi:MAG TPA: alpha-L-arabinofuranosidase C-terminal domain-containing protein [Spirochaetia bacterium]|nr:alpha-L-arabinofuranosidase C-terminal domain-containing protein [Spirochaetia bacterium]
MAEKNRLVVNTDREVATIDPNIYGHFAEHLGRCNYEGIWVGEESPISHVRGIRRDVVEALRRIKPAILRWPGGCFAEEYHWRDGVGPREARPRRMNTFWGGVVETNHFGTHEFFDLCEMIGAQPYICGNVSTGSPQEMQGWLEYLNGEGESELVVARRKNGRDGPFGLRYLGIGNENWGCGGRMRPEYYADLYRRFQNHAKSYGSERLFRIACGPRNDDYRWTEVLMRDAAPLMDGLALHYYTRFFSSGENVTEYRGSATQFGEDEWFRLLRRAWLTEELVQRHSTVMDRCDPARRVALVVDEWGTWFGVESGTNPHFLFQQNTMRDALVAAISLNIFNNHAERVRMANIAQTVNVLQAMILTEGKRMVLTPSYHVFDLFSVHQGARLLDASLTCVDYRYGEETIPSISRSASRSPSGTVNLTLCNANPGSSLTLDCEVRGDRFRTVSGMLLAASAMNAHNTFESPDQVRPSTFTAFRLQGDTLGVELPPMSVVRLSLDG